MEKTAKIIAGDSFIDERGKMQFVNGFDMRPVLRMYCITPEPAIIRAWQGHRQETKWLFAVKGSFAVKAVKPKTWDTPSQVKETLSFVLSGAKSEILEIPGGYLNGFCALETGSILMVFSDATLQDSQQDDIRVSLDELYWDAC